MDVVASGITAAGDVFSGFWGFATLNTPVMIGLVVSLVGVGIGLFFTIKRRLAGRGKR